MTQTKQTPTVFLNSSKNPPKIITPSPSGSRPNSSNQSPAPSGRNSKSLNKENAISSYSSIPNLTPEDIISINPEEISPSLCIQYGEKCYSGFSSNHTVNFSKAAEFFKYAADKNKDPYAMIKYGNMLRFGFGCEIDKDKAKEYFQRAANYEISDDCKDPKAIQDIKEQAKKLTDSLENREKYLPKILSDISESETPNSNGEPRGKTETNKDIELTNIKPQSPLSQKTPTQSPRKSSNPKNDNNNNKNNNGNNNNGNNNNGNNNNNNNNNSIKK